MTVREKRNDVQIKKEHAITGKRKGIHDDAFEKRSRQESHEMDREEKPKEQEHKMDCENDTEEDNQLVQDEVYSAPTIEVKTSRSTGTQTITRKCSTLEARYRRSDWKREMPEGFVKQINRTTVHCRFLKPDEEQNFEHDMFEEVKQDEYQVTKSGHVTHGVFDRSYITKEETANTWAFGPQVEELHSPDRRAMHDLRRITYGDIRQHNFSVFLDFESCRVLRHVKVKDANHKTADSFYMKETYSGHRTVCYGKYNIANSKFVGRVTSLFLLSVAERRVRISKYVMEDPIRSNAETVERTMTPKEFYHWFDDMFMMDMYAEERRPSENGTQRWPKPPDLWSFSTVIEPFDATIGVQ